jgi:predicted transcriptional regulator
MPTWPTPEGRKTITIEMQSDLLDRIDRQAQYLGCSRAAYIRQTMVRDLERQGSGIRNPN